MSPSCWIYPAQRSGHSRAGLTTSVRDRRGKYRFSFQDLILLRTAKELSQAAIHPRKIYRALRTLKTQLPMGAPLSAVRIVVVRDEVLIQDQQTVWHSEAGQAQLDFSVGEMANQIAPLIRGTAQEAEQNSDTSSDEWFELGLNFETAGATEDAKAAYARALELNPEHVLRISTMDGCFRKKTGRPMRGRIIEPRLY